MMNAQDSSLPGSLVRPAHLRGTARLHSTGHLCEETRAGGLSGKAWLILVVYVGSLNLFWLGGARTFTGHEGFPAQIAREMLATGDWLVPRIAGSPWLEKPPLPHWLIAICGAAAGSIDEFVARLPFALAGLLGVLLIASLAARWYGSTHGLLTGLVQATTFYTITYARLAEADMVLWVLVLGCLWLFARENVAPRERLPWNLGPVCFYVLLGLTQLAKGPLFGAMMVLLPCAGLLLTQRSLARWKWFFSPTGILIAAVLTVAWPLAILLRYPEAADLWWVHTFGRVAGSRIINPEPFWYYLTTVPWQLLPWSLLALPALPSTLRQAWRERESPERFLALWFLLPLILLSVISAKHHHYLIYALPPCSFLAAEGILRIRDAIRKRLSGPWPALCLSVAAAALVAGAIVAVNAVRPQYAGDALILGSIVVPAAAITVAALKRGANRLAAASVFLALWGAYGYVHAGILWKTDRYREETALYRRLQEEAGPNARILVYGLEPSRLLLYCDMPAEVFVDARQLWERYQAESNPYVITSLFHEYQLAAVAQPEVVFKMEESRWEKLGPMAQLVVFRLTPQDREPPSSAP